jgi:hypothetical protein
MMESMWRANPPSEYTVRIFWLELQVVYVYVCACARGLNAEWLYK